jgi:hypothetical protein
MKTWLRGDRWEVQPGKILNRFPIRSDKFDENELILPFHLTGEGFPSIWGPAHAFSIRLNHSDHRFDEKDAAYQEQCRQAARDLLTMVIAQFLGLLKPDEIPLEGSEPNSAPASRLLRLLKHNLETESRSMPALIVLRDPRLTGAPIAAVNYPDCLWFPVHSYKLDMVGRRIEEMLGRIELTGLIPAQRQEEREKEELKALVGQLRAYLRQFLPAGSDVAPYARVLATFENGLSKVAEPGSAPIRSGRAFGLASGMVWPIELRRSGDTVPVDTGCPKCGQDWMNLNYPGGPRKLTGGGQPIRKVTCPQHNSELKGWDDLMSRGVFFDEVESEYVIWADDPTDEGGQDLQFPPNGERVDVKRGPDGKGEARFRFNKAEIIVSGRVVKRSEVLLKQVVELPQAAGLKALPINGEESVCVDWSEAGGITKDESQSGYWNVRLRGGWRPFAWQAETFRDPVLSEPDNVTLLLWPGFDDPKWKAETVVYGISNGGRNSPRVRCYGAGPRKQRMLGEHFGLDIAHSMLRLKERVEALEFRSSGNEPLGFLQPKRRTLYPGPVSHAILALDFGTSNTAISWKAPTEPPKEVAMDQEALPLELLAPSSPEQKEKIAKDLSLLPFWPKLSPARWCIPSELLVFKESGLWTIPHDSLDPAHLETQDIRRDFKWLDETNTLRPIYLRMVLQMALANLRTRGITDVDLRATYPLAFDPGHLGGYDAVLDDLVTRLSDETGMKVRIAGYVNESISGLQACAQQSGNLHCVIDFGGGTTDIAVRIVDPKKGFGEPLFVDSLRLAGSDVIESLLADQVLLDGILKHGKAALSASAPPEVRQKVARQIVLGELRSSTSGLPPWWRDLVQGHQREQSDAAQLFAMRNRAFFDGVLAYVLKLISVAEQEMHRNGALRDGEGARADVFLLGQGWGLLRLQVGRGEHDPQAYVRSRLEELRSALPFSPPKCQFDVYLPGYQVRHALKLATSFGAALLPGVSIKPAAELENKTGRQTVFGVDVSFTDGGKLESDDFLDSAKEKNVITGAQISNGAWDQFAGPLLKAPGIADHVRQLFGPTEADRRKFVESRVNYEIQTHVAPQLTKNVPPRTSPLLLLLEHVWAEQLKRLEGGQVKTP